MSKKQIQKNIQLSEKLANYLAKNPEEVGKTPSDSSFVVFSIGDKNLNRLNGKLVKDLAKQGKSVIKAEETKSLKTPWVFTPCFT